MLTPDDILDLGIGSQTDILVSGHMGWRVYQPTQNIETCYRIEETLLKVGKAAPYVAHLKTIVVEEGEEGLPKDWLLAHASPLQRCKAFLLTNIS
jgi:hypothetical protein